MIGQMLYNSQVVTEASVALQLLVEAETSIAAFRLLPENVRPFVQAVSEDPRGHIGCLPRLPRIDPVTHTFAVGEDAEVELPPAKRMLLLVIPGKTVGEALGKLPESLHGSIQSAERVSPMPDVSGMIYDKLGPLLERSIAAAEKSATKKEGG